MLSDGEKWHANRLVNAEQKGYDKGRVDGLPEWQYFGGSFRGEETTDQEDIRHPRQVENDTREATSGVRKSHRVRSQPHWLEDYDTSTST